jgi:hydroxymethylbilane synthase
VSEQSIRIATRSSNLALWQADYIANLMREISPDRTIERVHVSTAGDREQSEPLNMMGSFGLFTREVQKYVQDGSADLAVHSLKDLPTDEVHGLALAAVPERGSMFDVLVLPAKLITQIDPENPLDGLLPQARIGTGSPRRQAQLLYHRSDLNVIGVRGNVETRLRKLDEGQFDALVLAEAGLRRLSHEHRISAILKPPLLYPAVSQGALGIECRSDDEETLSLLTQITDPVTFAAVKAERTLLAELRAGCHAPLGVSTSYDSNQLKLEAVVLSHDGKQRIHAESSGDMVDPVSIGSQLAEKLRQQGAEDLVEAARRNAQTQ